MDRPGLVLNDGLKSSKVQKKVTENRLGHLVVSNQRDVTPCSLVTFHGTSKKVSFETSLLQQVTFHLCDLQQTRMDPSKALVMFLFTTVMTPTPQLNSLAQT
jgi:hypothetical protein